MENYCLDGFDSKIEILEIIMEKYSGKTNFSYNRPSVDNVKVFEIKVGRAEGRVYGY